jgi:Repeat of unknown function (DUF346)
MIPMPTSPSGPVSRRSLLASALLTAGVAGGVPLVAPTAANATCSSIPAEANDNVITTVYRTALNRKVTSKVMLATFEAGWVESHMNNLACGDKDSLGVFQQRDSWGTAEQRLNVAWATNAFLDQAIPTDINHPEYSAGQLAQAVQRSAFPDRYDQAQAKANELIARARSLIGPSVRSGKAPDGPAVYSRGSGDAHVFVRGTDNKLYQAYYNGSWHWQSVGGAIASSPAVYSRGSGDAHVFVRGTDRNLYQAYYNGSWHWQSVGNGGSPLADPDTTS